MVNKKIEVYKDLPIKVKVKTPGYWDYNQLMSFNEAGSYKLDLQKYDGFIYEIYNSDLNPKSIKTDTSLLPDYMYVDAQTKVLMPYDDGKVYHNTCVQEKNVYFKNVGCHISDTNIASGFSTSKYLKLDNRYKRNDITFYIKFTTPDSFNNRCSLIHSRYFINLELNNSDITFYNWGTSETITLLSATANTEYWVKIRLEENNRYYSYSTNGQDYSSELSITDSSIQVNSDYEFRLGLSSLNNESPFNGTINLNADATYITENATNSKIWYYNMATEVSHDLKGCLYNYTDTGAAATLNCFYHNNEYLLTADETITGGQYLGQVDIPQHDLFAYSETPYQVYDNFTVVGTAVSVDQESGKTSGFSSSSYLDTGYIPSLPANTPWKMRVRFKYDKVNSFQVFLSGTTYANAPYIAVGTNYLVDCGISDGGSRITWIEGTTVLEDGANYIVEFSYDGNTTYTVRLKREDGGWNTENTYTYDGKAAFGSNLYIGRNGSGYARGVIDLSTDTYFEIGGVKTWIPTTTHYNTTWEKQS